MAASPSEKSCSASTGLFCAHATEGATPKESAAATIAARKVPDPRIGRDIHQLRGRRLLQRVVWTPPVGPGFAVAGGFVSAGFGGGGGGSAGFGGGSTGFT